MIIDKYVKIKLNSKNKNRLINLGYIGKINDTIEILVEHLSKYSQCKINVKCDICGKCKTILFSNYTKQTNNNTNDYYCSDCKKIKTKNTCLEKYGVDCPMKTNKVKNTLKQNNILKYGVENVFQSEKIKEKIKETNLIKYGKPFYNNRKKSKKTCIKKYGVGNPLQNKKIKEKVKKTCLEKYGVMSYMNTKMFRKASIDYINMNKYKMCKNRKDTTNKKYGVENVFELEHIKEKIKKTCLEKYGVEYPAQNEFIFLKTQKSRFKIKKYKDSDIFSQGTYEKDFLEKFYERIKIKRSKPIIYFFNKKNHYYHPDFYLPEFNLIVEIKSKYIYELELEQNILKKQACLDNGYNYIFIIDKNYIEIEKIINDDKKYNDKK